MDFGFGQMFISMGELLPVRGNETCRKLVIGSKQVYEKELILPARFFMCVFLLHISTVTKSCP